MLITKREAALVSIIALVLLVFVAWGSKQESVYQMPVVEEGV